MNNPDAAAPGQRSGADLLCDTLLAEGVDMCFANPGTSEMHFVAALDRQPQMRCVLGLFEGVVSGAADGYARMADKPACTLLHTGPGLANALANLHNAKRAGTPIVNVVGDHSTPHLPFDAPLTTDIEGLARPMSHWVGRSQNSNDLGRAAQEAVNQARQAPGRIATLILPADHAWGPATVGVPAARQAPAPAAPVAQAIAQAAAACRQGQATPGSTVLLLAGKALRDEALHLASRIAAATGVRLLAQQASTRVQRGLGRVMIDRVPYVVDVALKFLAPTQRMVLVGAKAPVGFFGYPGKPSSMLPVGCEVVTASTPDQCPLATLRALAQALGVASTAGPAPGMAAERQALPLPQGALNAQAIARSVVAQLPPDAIVVDESVSSGRDFFPMSWHAAPHDYLQLTGGAIGAGLPLATGAALGAPGRKVVTLQADGSAMYTVQALWTQARERLPVVTIVFANRKYAILHGELKHVGAAAAGENARRMLDLDNPALDWVALAKGLGVEGTRVDTAEGFNAALAAALKANGPFLIEAVI